MEGCKAFIMHELVPMQTRQIQSQALKAGSPCSDTCAVHVHSSDCVYTTDPAAPSPLRGVCNTIVAQAHARKHGARLCAGTNRAQATAHNIHR